MMKPTDLAMKNARCICGCPPVEARGYVSLDLRALDVTDVCVVFACGTRVWVPVHHGAPQIAGESA